MNRNIFTKTTFWFSIVLLSDSGCIVDPITGGGGRVDEDRGVLKPKVLLSIEMFTSSSPTDNELIVLCKNRKQIREDRWSV